MRLICSLLMAAVVAWGDPSVNIDRAFHRLYSFDFTGAQAILAQQERADPAYPLTYSVRAAAHLFSELDRLGILEADFFLDDDNVIATKKLKPDPSVRAAMLQAIEAARSRANARLAVDPSNVCALFAHCMSSSILTDYTVLVERKQWRGFTLARETHEYAKRLLALDPPFYDAYLTVGSVEYVIGSMPFFLRWFVRFDTVQGNKQKASELLRLVAERGRYYAPFARILLAVIHLREKQPALAQAELAVFLDRFPENPLIRKELDRLAQRTPVKPAPRVVR